MQSDTVKRRLPKVQWMLAVVCTVTVFVVYQFSLGQRLSEQDARQLGLVLFEEPRALEPINLISDSGKRLTQAAFEGQWNLLFFGFTHCPDICPTTMATLAKVNAEGLEFPRVWLVTVDPRRDTPSQLDAYLNKFDPSFTGITGEISEIKALASQLHLAVGHAPHTTSASYSVGHRSSLGLVDTRGRPVGYIKAPHTISSLQSIMGHLDRI